MDAIWYDCFNFFGYEIKIPDDTTYRKFINKILALNSVLKESFQITGILPAFHSRMEGMDSDESKLLDKGAYILLGFYPDDDLTKMMELSRELSEYIIDNPLFEGFEFSSKSGFYSGITWNVDNYDSDDDSEYVSDNSDSDSDSDSDLEESEEDLEESEKESEEEEEEEDENDISKDEDDNKKEN